MFSTTNLQLLGTTAFIAVSSALLSLVVAYPFSIWLRSLGQRLSRTVSTLVIVPFLLPPLLVAVALNPLSQSLNINSNFGMLIILFSHVLMNFGFLARVLAGTAISAEQIESAKLDGASSWQIRRLLELPQQLPAAVSATLLVALYSATSYGLIQILGKGTVRTLETEIAKSALQNLDLQQALTLALLQSLLTLALFLVARQYLTRPALLDEIQSRSGRIENWIAGYSIALSLLIGGFLASAMSGALSGPGLLSNFENLAGRGARDLLNITVLEAAANSVRNAVVTVLVAFPLAYLLAASKRSHSWILIPLGISPVVIGLGFLLLTGYLPRALTSSWILLPLVQVLFALPVAYQILRPAISGLDKEILAAAKLDGAGFLKLKRFIEFPMLSKSIGLSLAFSALVSLGEFGAASFLAFGSNETLPIVMFKLISRPGAENLGMAMTAASIHILLVAYIVWVSLKPTRTQREVDQVSR